MGRATLARPLRRHQGRVSFGVQLPVDLAAALEIELQGTGTKALEQAALQLSQTYRQGGSAGERVLRSADLRSAYLAVRLPATFAAVSAALRQTFARLTDAGAIHSVLDLGAGPGTAAWAATEMLPALETLTLVERERELVSLGRRLFARAHHPALVAARWEIADLAATPALAVHDVVVVSYVLGELPEDAARNVVQAAIAATRVALVLIEPGTPAGFARLRTLREWAVGQGLHVIAPCPHGGPCPVGSGDWCHFAARVERSALHRRLKGGALGHEDEKFAYVALSPRPVLPVAARVVRHPLIRPGRVTLELCTPEGLVKRGVSKRERPAWRAVRRIRWGDAWQPEVDAATPGLAEPAGQDEEG
jgi:ribosomal protein RSM22 (predicted rRNA methylase)